DTLGNFFFAGEFPTGSKDPFALRRAAMAIIRLIVENDLRCTLAQMVVEPIMSLCVQVVGRAEEKNTEAEMAAFDRLGIEFDFDEMIESHKETVTQREWVEKLVLNPSRGTTEQILNFFSDRLKVQQREAGVRHDLIDAVFALGNEDDLVRLLARVRALQNFIQTEDGANLLAGYKRAANILKKEDWQGVEGEIAQTGEEDPLALIDDPDLAPVVAAKMEQRRENEHSYSPEPAEKALIEALDSAEPRARAAVEAEDFEAAMAALAILRAPIDRFFDEVTVNDADKAKRAARLALLARFRDAVHQVADFSRIEG